MGSTRRSRETGVPKEPTRRPVGTAVRARPTGAQECPDELIDTVQVPTPSPPHGATLGVMLDPAHERRAALVWTNQIIATLGGSAGAAVARCLRAGERYTASVERKEEEGAIARLTVKLSKL